jgi:hypothetical protein
LTLNATTGRITGTPAAVGSHNVTVFVNDGLVTVSRSFTWTVTTGGTGDQTGPVLTITSHISGQNVAATSITLTGTASDSGRGNRGIASVTVNGQPATGGTASGTGTANWSRTISLSTGANVIAVQATDGAGNVTTQQITITRTAPTCQSHDDSNRDCRADLVWRNSVSGQNVIWYLNGTTVLGSEWLPTVADPAWQLAASADINRDGARDLIWRNRVSGQNVVWYLNGTTVVGDAWLPTVADPAWQLAASADLNRDGSADLIWRNNTTGQNAVWYLNRTAKIGESALPQVDSRWRLMAAADTDGDGTAELIWRHTSTGANKVWHLNGATFARSASLPTVSDQTWKMLGSR